MMTARMVRRSGKALLLRKRVDALRETEVKVRQTAFAVGREQQPHLIKTNIDVGVMLFLLGHFRDCIHKVDGIGKIVELKGALDVFLFEFPFGHLL